MPNIEKDYFEWLCQKVTNDDSVTRGLYRKLLMELHTIKFVYSVPLDRNRAADGVGLRDRFALEITHNDFTKIEEITSNIIGDCSVLEMMVALVLRCEETIMDDTRFGNRTE